MSLPKFKFTVANIFNVIGIIVILNLVFVLAQTIQRNYRLGLQVDDLRDQTALLQEQKDQLSYSIEYYKTDAFRDREARAKLGLQLPGENVIIIPRPSATPVPAPVKAAPKRTNLQQWFDFLQGRQP